MNPGHSANWKWRVCGVLLLATMLNYMDRQALAVTLPELKARYALGEARIGLVEGCFGFAFAFGSVAFGWLADRFGPRLLYPLVLAGWSAAGIATGFAGHEGLAAALELPGDDPGAGTFRWLVGCRVVLGVCEAGHWPCALITARQILAATDRPLGNAVLQSGASLGAILVPLYIQLVESLGAGWEFAFWSVGAAGLLWIPAWLALVRPGDLDGVPPAPATGPVAPGDTAGFVRRFVVLAVIVSCLTVSWQFLRAWLPLFLQDFHRWQPLDTRLAVSGYFIAADVGCILAGVLVRTLVKKGWAVHAARVLGFAGFAGLTAVAAVVPVLGSGPVMVAGLMIAGAGILGLHPYYYAFIQELPGRRMGLLSGVLAGCGWVVSGVFQILIGKRIEAAGSYDTGLVIAGVAPVVGLVVLLVLWKPDRRA